MDDKSILFHCEANAARLERTIVRMWVVIILLIFLLVGTNYAWIYYENQFQDMTTMIEAEQDGSGVNIIGGGDVGYGTESKDHN